MTGRFRQWLAGLDLDRYADLFAENDVDFDVLPELSDGELKELGLSLGHRKRLLKAVAELTTKPDAGPDPAPGPSQTP